MDYGTFHGIYTIVLMVCMFGIIGWAYSKRRKKSFDEAANLVFADDEKAKDAVKE
ncbi:cbb3-type cytochrome oxidase subunit 3 [Ferrimonas marina]|uniref:Cytochrome c oxidase cbb3-type subunit 4 n=1 Tax=Ferrimonas marina TaxID=299255 RepID=A0A1M5NCK4_9GAMM|nr:CcoQ/FixQ family Cbb3-type cytochrome c oxidase assembly chaperone [Ferrimonas marina]SHG87217.1 cytochrome c oxidase cbb3-type subunit 4 [Ferrimonas marina]